MKPSVAAMLLCLCVVTVLPAVDNATNPYGVCSHLTFNSVADASRKLDSLAGAGVGWVRADFPWGAIEATQGVWTFTRFDDVVSAAESRGISILPILLGPPAYGKPTYAQPALSFWKQYVATVVRRYSDRLRYWEICNETNLIGAWSTFCSSAEPPNAGRYVTILKAAYDTIKAIDPSLTVVLVGLANVPASPWGVPYGYIDSMYAAGLKDCYDVMNIHPYRWSGAVRPEYQFANRGDMFTEFTGLRAYLAGKGDGAKPIWITEVGYPTFASGATEEQQGLFAPRTYLLSLQSGVQRVFWYELVDDGTDPADQEDHFGLLGMLPGLAPKPAWRAHQALTRARPAGSAVLDSSMWISADRSVCYPHWRRPDGRTGWALWRQDGSSLDYTLTITGSIDSAFTYLNGDTTANVKAALQGGRLTLRLGPGVIYLIGPTQINTWGTVSAQTGAALRPRAAPLHKGSAWYDLSGRRCLGPSHVAAVRFALTRGGARWQP